MIINEKELKTLCQKYGLTYELKFGNVYLHTKFETFYFEENEKKKVKLMHQSTIFSNSEYHTQFYKKISLDMLLRYVKEHTESKYTSKFVHYSVAV